LRTTDRYTSCHLGRAILYYTLPSPSHILYLLRGQEILHSISNSHSLWKASNSPVLRIYWHLQFQSGFRAYSLYFEQSNAAFIYTCTSRDHKGAQLNIPSSHLKARETCTEHNQPVTTSNTNLIIVRTLAPTKKRKKNPRASAGNNSTLFSLSTALQLNNDCHHRERVAA
jgi:hypothetical protein